MLFSSENAREQAAAGIRQKSQLHEDVLVHVIDDDPNILDAISSVLSTVSLEHRTYVSARHFLSAERGDLPGCIVLDVRLPGGQSGLELLEQFASLGVGLPVVLMTGYGDVAMSVRAMKAGAVDFLSKPVRAQDLIDAITTAIQRDRKKRAAEMELVQLRARFSSLSPREKQILPLVAAGLLNKQIGWRLGISEAGAKVSRSVMMRKIKAQSVVDVVRMAHRLGLQEDQSGTYMDRRVEVQSSLLPTCESARSLSRSKDRCGQ